MSEQERAAAQALMFVCLAAIILILVWAFWGGDS